MRGYIRKRGKTYSYTVDVGRNPDTGKRMQKSKGGFKTKKEAQEALNNLVYEVNKGTYIIDQDSTFEEYALDWFNNMKHRLRPTTAEQYEVKIRKWLIPFIGKVKLQDLTPMHGTKLVQNLLAELEPSTASKNFFIANYILNDAVKFELIHKNPFRHIPKPKEESKEIQTWTFADIKKIEAYEDKEERFYLNVIKMAVFTGMRKGEILGLRRQDVHFDENKLYIRQSVSETKETNVVVGPLKTKASRRQIAIDKNIVRIIKDQIKRNNEYKLFFGQTYQDNDLIFCKEDGRPFRPSSINRPFRRIIEKAGVPYIRFHDLRHTHATLMLELGINPKMVADRLGHSTVKITLDTYTHVTSDIQAKAMETFTQAYQSK